MKANNTEFYAEYIEGGGDIPTAFALIPDLNNVSFADLFYEHFCDRELGFETEGLFAIKLNAKADIICPLYSDKILSLKKISVADGATHKNESTENGTTETANNYFNAPDNVAVSDVETPKPGSLVSQDRGKNSINNHTITNKDSGFTVDEMLRVEEDLYKYKSIYEQLLNEFEPLFLGVWAHEN